MRTAKFYFTRKAVEDLSSIWDYTAQEWSEAQADRYYRRLIAACRKIAENPVLYGRRYDKSPKTCTVAKRTGTSFSIAP